MVFARVDAFRSMRRAECAERTGAARASARRVGRAGNAFVLTRGSECIAKGCRRRPKIGFHAAALLMSAHLPGEALRLDDVNFMDFLAEAASFMLSTFDYMPIYETLWVY